jgi:hypothetical protein
MKLRNGFSAYRPLTRVAALVVFLAFAGEAAGQAEPDICGCKDHPDSLGVFDTAVPESFPPGTTVEGRNMTIPLPPDGVLVFDEIRATPWGSGYHAIFFARNGANTPVTLLVSGDLFVAEYLAFQVGGDDGLSGQFEVNGRGGRPGRDGGEGQGPLGGAPGTGRMVSEAEGEEGEPAEEGTEVEETVEAVLTAGGDGGFGGRPELLPLIGGSGGGGGGSARAGNCSASGGAGGGGAILIAVNGAVQVDGSVDADGGKRGYNPSDHACASRGGYGRGGAVRILAREVSGTGWVIARGGRGEGGLNGVIRIESLTEDRLNPDHVRPPAIRASVIGPLANPIAATIAITAIGEQTVPAELSGVTGGVDVIVPAPGQVAVQVETSGVPAGTTVEVAMKPRVGGAALRQTGELDPASCTPTGECRAFVTFDLPSGSYFAEAVATFRTP